MKGRDALMSSAKQDWRTPEYILGWVREIGLIALDPCTSWDNPTRAKRFFTEEDDGLESLWFGAGQTGLAFVNPPYNEIANWADRMAAEGCSNGTELVALVPARTDTKWFQKIATADAIAFLIGRVKFEYGENALSLSSAPFPSCLAYWGPNVDRFEAATRGRGKAWVVRP